MIDALTSVFGWLGSHLGAIWTAIGPLVGVVLGGSLVWWGDARKDKRALEREREARRDAFLHQHLKEEREALLRVSEELHPLLRLYESSLEDEAHVSDFTDQYIKILTIAQRCSDVKVVKSVQRMIQDPELPDEGLAEGENESTWKLQRKVDDYFEALRVIRLCIQERDMALLGGSEGAVSSVLEQLKLSIEFSAKQATVIGGRDSIAAEKDGIQQNDS